MAKWQDNKDLRKLEGEVEYSLTDWIEKLEVKAVEAYYDSDDFCIDALQYAKEQGWEPV